MWYLVPHNATKEMCNVMTPTYRLVDFSNCSKMKNSNTFPQSIYGPYVLKYMCLEIYVSWNILCQVDVQTFFSKSIQYITGWQQMSKDSGQVGSNYSTLTNVWSFSDID
jgi:hypothetical protein